MGSFSQIWKQERLSLNMKLVSFHDVHHSSFFVRLGVVDPLGLGYQSSGSFLYALSETDSPCEVAGYDSKHCHCRDIYIQLSLIIQCEPAFSI